MWNEIRNRNKNLKIVLRRICCFIVKNVFVRQKMRTQNANIFELIHVQQLHHRLHLKMYGIYFQISNKTRIDLGLNFYINSFSCRSFFISEYLLYRSKSCFSTRKCTHVSPKRSCRGMFEFFTGNRAQHSHTNCLPGYVASFHLVSHFIYTAHCFDVFHLKKGPTVIGM